MNNQYMKRNRTLLKTAAIMFPAAALMVLLSAGRLTAYPKFARKQVSRGPWEIMVGIGKKKNVLSYPVKVPDVDTPRDIAKKLPVLGTPFTVMLKKYIPDLNWETRIQPAARGGSVAELLISGGRQDKTVWLSTSEATRRSIKSPRGGVQILKLCCPERFTETLEELKQSRSRGLISVRDTKKKIFFDCAAVKGKTITIPDTAYHITVLDYMPHYFFDTETKEVRSLSEKPLNPAVKVRVADGEREYERWLWSKFAESPHHGTADQLDIRFCRLDPGRQGNYYLATAEGKTPRLLYGGKNTVRMEKAVEGKSYPFLKQEYSFTIQQVSVNAEITTSWANHEKKLKNPAFIAVIGHDDSQEVILEYNKPQHVQTKYGTLVILYRNQKNRPGGHK